jgi:hypothetical protein
MYVNALTAVERIVRASGSSAPRGENDLYRNGATS